MSIVESNHNANLISQDFFHVSSFVNNWYKKNLNLMVEFMISKIFVDFDKISCFSILNLGAKWWWRGYSNGRTPKTATRPN